MRILHRVRLHHDADAPKASCCYPGQAALTSDPASQSEAFADHDDPGVHDLCFSTGQVAGTKHILARFDWFSWTLSFGIE